MSSVPPNMGSRFGAHTGDAGAVFRYALLNIDPSASHSMYGSACSLFGNTADAFAALRFTTLKHVSSYVAINVGSA